MLMLVLVGFRAWCAHSENLLGLDPHFHRWPEIALPAVLSLRR